MPPARRSARTVSAAARESAQPYTRANTRTSPGATRSSASIARPANGKTSLRLTVKAPPSKLRQATSGSQVSSIPPNPYADNPSESDVTPAPRIARTTRNPRIIVDPDSEESDELDEDAQGEEEDDEDAGGDVDQELLGKDDSEDDAEGEDEDMDELQQDHPPSPVIKQDRPTGKAKPNVTVTAPSEGPLKSVEAKEMEDDEDEELSELESNDNEEDEDEDEDEESDDEEDENSRSATPDLTKLTKRQRGAFDEVAESSLLALSNEAQKKKHLTAEEHAMRRAEMARRRKNLSEKRNEEEKVCWPSDPLPTPLTIFTDGHHQQIAQEAGTEASNTSRNGGSASR